MLEIASYAIWIQNRVRGASHPISSISCYCRPHYMHIHISALNVTQVFEVTQSFDVDSSHVAVYPLQLGHLHTRRTLRKAHALRTLSPQKWDALGSSCTVSTLVCGHNSVYDFLISGRLVLYVVDQKYLESALLTDLRFQHGGIGNWASRLALVKAVRILAPHPGVQPASARSRPGGRHRVTDVTASTDACIDKASRLKACPHNVRTPTEDHAPIDLSLLYEVRCILTMHILSPSGCI